MIAKEQMNALRGTAACDRDGREIGTVEQVYFDDATGSAEWVTVRTGLFGMPESLVRSLGRTLRGDGLVVATSKHTVKDAPRVDADSGHLSADEEAELYRYYGLSPTGLGTETGTGYRAERGGDAMTRSEEHLRVGVERRELGRARLRKYLVTENTEQPVQVRREEVRLEREPITDDNRDAARSGPDTSRRPFVGRFARSRSRPTSPTIAPVLFLLSITAVIPGAAGLTAALSGGLRAAGGTVGGPLGTPGGGFTLGSALWTSFWSLLVGLVLAAAGGILGGRMHRSVKTAEHQRRTGDPDTSPPPATVPAPQQGTGAHTR